MVLGNENFTILKTKIKTNKKNRGISYEFILESTEGLRSTASFVSFKKEKNGEEQSYQFYLSNSEIDLSFDLHE